MFAIHAEPMYYDWGSSSRFRETFAREIPEGLSLAELWLGTHPRGPSRLADPQTGRPLLTASDLGSIVARHSESCLGSLAVADPVQAQNSGESKASGHRELPYLLKILGADKALSIQVHPDKVQAQEGFDRENRLGLPIDAKNRNYKDANHKPECILALSEFYALQGFREPAEIVASLEPASALLRNPLSELSKPEPSLGGFLAKSLSLDAEDLDAALAQLSEAAEAALAADGEIPDTSPHRWFLRMKESFPGDPGLLAAYYLNIVKIMPGQALVLEARVLHAYLEGIGVELMANSDNVLRAGCTSKHVDVDELLRVCATESGAGRKSEPQAGTWLESGFEEFRLYIGGKSPAELLPADGQPRIVLALGTELELAYGTAPDPSTNRLASEPGFSREVRLGPGKAAFVPANASEITLRVRKSAGAAGTDVPAWVMAAPGLREGGT